MVAGEACGGQSRSSDRVSAGCALADLANTQVGRQGGGS